MAVDCCSMSVNADQTIRPGRRTSHFFDQLYILWFGLSVAEKSSAHPGL